MEKPSFKSLLIVNFGLFLFFGAIIISFIIIKGTIYHQKTVEKKEVFKREEAQHQKPTIQKQKRRVKKKGQWRVTKDGYKIWVDAPLGANGRGKPIELKIERRGLGEDDDFDNIWLEDASGNIISKPPEVKIPPKKKSKEK